jgi:hypothetical protein
VFPDKPVTSFQHLVLRSSSEDQFETLFRDAFAQTLTKGTTLDRQAYRPVVLFINDLYWGIYNLREAATEEYIEDTYGYNEDDIDVIEYDGISYQVRAGTGDNFANFFSFIYHNDLSVPANYETLKTMLDVENALDYFAYEIYAGNKDWPGNNIRYWRPRAAGAKWRFLLFDLDNGFRQKNLLDDTLAYATNTTATGVFGSHNEPQHTMLLRSLLRSPEFVTEFIRRMDAIGNITFAPSRVGALVQQMAWGIYPEMPREIDRWWTGLGIGLDLAGWYNEVIELWTFANWRPTVMNYVLAKDFNLPDRSALGVDVTGGGTVRINSLKPDSYPYYGTHVSKVSVRLKAEAEPGYRFDRWTGSVESTAAEILVDMTQTRNVTAVFVAETP